MSEGQKLHELIEYMYQLQPILIGDTIHYAKKIDYTHEQLTIAFKKPLFGKRIDSEEINRLCSIFIFDKIGEPIIGHSEKKLQKVIGIKVNSERVSEAYQTKRYLNADNPKFSYWKGFERIIIFLGGAASAIFIYDRIQPPASKGDPQQIQRPIEQQSPQPQSTDTTKIALPYKKDSVPK